jgi:hypothetical protein
MRFQPQTILRDDVSGSNGPDTGGGVSAPAESAPVSSNPFAPTPTTPPAATEPTAPVEPAAQEPAAPVQPAATPPVTLTPEQLQQLAGLMRGPEPQQQQQQVQQPQTVEQMDDATFAKTFNIVSVDAGTYEQILGVPPSSPQQVAALHTTLQGIARQAVTMSRYLAEKMVNEKFSQLETQVQPLAQTHREQMENRVKDTFFTKYADLKAYEPGIREIVDAARARGMQFPTQEAAMEYVATTARKLFNVAPGAVAGRNPAQGGQPAGSRAMTPMSMGGRSGQGGTATPPQSTAQRIFG